MTVEPKFQAASVVVNGSFSPERFSPAWLRHVAILDDDAFEGAETNGVTPNGTQLNLGTYTLNVQPNQFWLHTSQEPFIRIADVAVQLFGEILPHTVIRQLGINYVVHFDAGSRAKKDLIGRKLAPLSPWGEWGESIAQDKSNKSGGLLNLTMQRNRSEGDFSGYQQINVQPSSMPFQSGGGVYMLINNHYEINVDPANYELCRIITSKFDNDISNARNLVEILNALGAKK